MSIVRDNLLKEPGYMPYCGGETCQTMPRTFFNGEQFQCPSCGWKSSFEPEFIEEYKAYMRRMKDGWRAGIGYPK